MIIAVSGKGGMGKSTLAALIVRHLTRDGQGPTLAVDADPNSTLAEKLGITAQCTIGDLREDTLRNKSQSPAGVPKQRGLECEVQNSIAESDGFDLLVMGRGEGPGCYCAVNNMLRTFLQDLSSGYKHVVIDNEAGIEHLSRCTNDRVDLMLVVSDQTPTGLKSAQRIAELSAKLGLVQGRIVLVLNRADASEDVWQQAAAATGLEALGCVPEDPLIQDFELRSEPLLRLPDDSPAVVAVSDILKSIGL